MSEKENQESEDTSQDNDAGNKLQTTPIIESANVAAKRMEEATEAMKLENDRKENFLVRDSLGGKSEAGEVKKEEVISDEEYSTNLLAGKYNG